MLVLTKAFDLLKARKQLNLFDSMNRNCVGIIFEMTEIERRHFHRMIKMRFTK